MLLEGLLSYFEPSFLAFTLVMGYLWYFLFFFKTKHWDDLEWPERFFFGFLIGLVSMFAFILIYSPIMIFLVAVYAEHLFPQLLYMAPVVFSTFLLAVRFNLGVPLSSEKAKDQFLRFLAKHKSYWLYLLPILSVGIYLGFGWNNSFLSASSRSLLAGFFILINMSVFYAYFIISFLVTQLSCIPFKSARAEAIEKVLMFVFPFWKRETEETRVRAMRGKQHVKKAFVQSDLSLLKNDFFHKVLLVALLSAVVTLADSAFHVVTPAVQTIETQYEADKIEVFRYFNAPIVYNIEVARTYWIRLPLVNVRNLNLSIPNPSNFSVYDASEYIPWEKEPYAMDIEADSSLSYTAITNQEGEIEFVNVMSTNVPRSKHYSFIKLVYNDMLNVGLINANEPREKNLGNGSILVTISLIINNTLARRLHSEDFALFSVERYGNLTSFEVFENGIKKPSPSKTITYQWLWIPLSVNPNTFLNLTASAVFEEMKT